MVVADGGCENESKLDIIVNFGTPTISPVAHACVSLWVMMGTVSSNRGLDLIAAGSRTSTFPGEACGKEGPVVREFAVDLPSTGRSALIIHSRASGQKTHDCTIAAPRSRS